MRSYLFCLLFFSIMMLGISSCKEAEPKKTDIVQTTAQLENHISDNIKSMVLYAFENKGKINDSLSISVDTIVKQYYEATNFKRIWSHEQDWKAISNQLFSFIESGKLYGLFPQDYHLDILDNIRNRINLDTLKKSDRFDAALWSRADVLLTDAFFHIAHDLHKGRIEKDSLTYDKDSIDLNILYINKLNKAMQSDECKTVLQSLEPTHLAYHQLKKGLANFLDSANFTDTITYLEYPVKKDTAQFIKSLIARMKEVNAIPTEEENIDSATLAAYITKFQKAKNLIVDGKYGNQLVGLLNLTDKEKFLRIAIALDKYKMLPPKMPKKFLWVNLPGYYLELMDDDTVRLESKIVCGKPKTRSPLLTSTIYNLVTYPQWNIPASIIEKEVLPGLKRNPEYTIKKGYMIINSNGEEIDPHTVNWKKYSKGIPYKVVQGSGDDNALGILKFNFLNKYSVYLHDTNQRGFFRNNYRALSHGCIRLQEWKKLALYLLRQDSLSYAKLNRKYHLIDSLDTWLKNKEKHTITLNNRLPIFIRYYTVAFKNNKLEFYEDIYGDDKTIRERYFKRNWSKMKLQ